MLQKLSIIPIMLAFLILGGCGSNQESIMVVTEFDLSVASSIKILQTTVDQMAHGEFDLLSKHMETGDFYVLSKGTKIEILKAYDNKYVKCLVLDGRHIDKKFWTFSLYFDYDYEYGSDIPFSLIVTQ